TCALPIFRSHTCELADRGSVAGHARTHWHPLAAGAVRLPAQQEAREVDREVVRRRVRTVRITELALEAEIDDPVDLAVREIAGVGMQGGELVAIGYSH